MIKREFGNRRTWKVRDKRPIILQQRARNEKLNQNAELNQLGWRIVGSTILHRFPVISKDLLPWQKEYVALDEKIGKKRRELLLDLVGGTDAQFFHEKDPTPEEILETLPFKPASRVTEADEKNDRRSPNRRLQDSLFLIVRRNRGNDLATEDAIQSFAWQFPQGRFLDNENNLRATAERTLDRAIGRTNRFFVSNAPIGFYQYPYQPPQQQQRKQYGSKVFFFRAQLLFGTIKLETKLYTDYAWIARDEVGEYFDKETAEYLKALLPD